MRGWMVGLANLLRLLMAKAGLVILLAMKGKPIESDKHKHAPGGAPDGGDLPWEVVTVATLQVVVEDGGRERSINLRPLVRAA